MTFALLYSMAIYPSRINYSPLTYTLIVYSTNSTFSRPCKNLLHDKE